MMTDERARQMQAPGPVHHRRKTTTTKTALLVQLRIKMQGCFPRKNFTPSHRMFGDVHGALNIDKK
jgi:hypothetical protein